VEPRMYREAIALADQRARPDSEVMLASEEKLDGRVRDLAPTCSCATPQAGISHGSNWVA